MSPKNQTRKKIGLSQNYLCSQRFVNYIKCQNDYIFTKIPELYQETKCFNTLE